MKIRGSTAIVTGSSRGIGRAIALKLAREGANIIVNYLKNESLAEDVVKEIREYGVEAYAVKADVSDYNEAGKIVEEAITRFGSIDILVNNAGIFFAKRIIELTPEDLDKIFKVNVYGPFYMVMHTVRHMIRQGGGVIINISSIASSVRTSKCLPTPGRVAYIASKSAINGLTYGLAMELAKYNIRVNAVAPGLTKTDMILNVPNLDERIKEIPLGKVVDPEAIADTVI